MAQDMPGIPDIFLNAPLYESFIINPVTKGSNFHKFIRFHGQFDTYCIDCACERTFLYVDGLYYQPSNARTSGIRDYEVPFGYTFRCVYDTSHCLRFYFMVTDDMLIKIGQYPSLADLAISELQRYRKVLNVEDYRELSKAVGLVSHGIGIGAFVYLRRIFERLIEEAHQTAKELPTWDEERYSKSRMNEKIGFFEGYLPPFLIRHKTLYSILSKGVHDLDENECLDAFPIVKGGIELILDEKIAEREKKRKLGELSKQVEKLHQQLKTSK